MISQMLKFSSNLYNELGFTVLQDWLSEQSHCEATQTDISNLTPTTQHAVAMQHLDLTGELVRFLEQESHIPIQTFPDIRTWLKALRIEGTQLNSEQFRELLLILQLGRLIRKVVTSDESSVWQQYENLFFEFPTGESAIHKVFDDDFQVKSSASPELSSIRKQIRSTETSIHKRMQSIFQEAMTNNWLQDDRISWMEGRLVLPMSASQKRKIQGIVHGRSGTGQTVYIEPMEIVEKNNDLQELRSSEIAEIHRILTELSRLFSPHYETIHDSFLILVRFDLHFVFAKLAVKLKCCRPQFSHNGRLQIRNGKNPILVMADKDVIPLSLVLTRKDHILLLSGPNAGGKTVVLKTIGLFSLMAQCGMFIPADDAIQPIFTRILTDIGDQQSMENDLSTFSAHIRNLREISFKADGYTLVLLDELGTGTDPDAGAAISQALLEHLLDRKSTVVATTHLGQLKLWAHDTSGIINGGMRFDPKNLVPTYELLTGQPGASYAIEISKRLGLSEKIIVRAKSLLGESSVKLEDLLNNLEKERSTAEKLATQMKDRYRLLSIREQEIDKLKNEIKQIRKKAKSDARKAAEDLIHNTRREMEHLVSQIRTSGADREVLRKSRGILQSQLTEFQAEDEQENPPIKQSLSPDEIEKGMTVHIPHLNATGIVIFPPDKKSKTTVEVNGIRLNLDFFLLSAADPKDNTESVSESMRGKFEITRPQSMQIDLRGKRVHEAMAELEKFLDGALVSGLPSVNILHGKGTGAIQEAVQAYLNEQTYVNSFSYGHPDEGGAGITIVHF